MSACGTCSACCRLMTVEPLNKPAGVWCSHCTPGSAHPCGIYETRPEPCKAFSCLWLKSQSRPNPAERLPPELKPNKCHVVLSITQDGEDLIVLSDPGYPGAWRKPRVMKLIERITLGGKRALLVEGEKRAVIDAGRD